MPGSPFLRQSEPSLEEIVLRHLPVIPNAQPGRALLSNPTSATKHSKRREMQPEGTVTRDEHPRIGTEARFRSVRWRPLAYDDDGKANARV